MAEPVILSAARTPTGKFLGALKSLSAPELGAIAIREALVRAGVSPDQVDECFMGNVVSAGHRPGAGSPGGTPRRASADGRRDDAEHGVRIGTPRRDARGAGRPDRRHQRGRRRRHGVDVEHAVRAAPPARRPAHGQRPDARLDDPRWPLVRVRGLAHGPVGRSRRQRVSRLARGSGQVRRRKPSSRRGRDRGRLVQGRDRPDLAAAEEGRRGGRRSRRADPCRHHRGSPCEAEARVQERWHRHGGQRARRERRRGGSGRRLRGLGAASTDTSRSRASWVRPSAVCRRSTS